MKNNERKAAELRVSQAKKALDKACDGSDDLDVLEANMHYKNAVADLVLLEMKFPTQQEVSRKRSRLRLENMGLTD